MVKLFGLGKAKEKAKDVGRNIKKQSQKSLEHGRHFYLNVDDALSKTSLGKTPLTMKGQAKVEEMMSIEDMKKAAKDPIPPVPALPVSYSDQKSEKKKESKPKPDSDSIRQGRVSDQAPQSRPQSKDRTSTRSGNQSKNRAGKSKRTEPTPEQLGTGSFYVEASDNSPVDESDEAPSAPRSLTAGNRSSTQRPSSRGTSGAGQSADKSERRGRER